LKAESGNKAGYYLKLLDYGFLRRSPHHAGVTVSVTEKALWGLALGE